MPIKLAITDSNISVILSSMDSIRLLNEPLAITMSITDNTWLLNEPLPLVTSLLSSHLCLSTFTCWTGKCPVRMSTKTGDFPVRSGHLVETGKSPLPFSGTGKCPHPLPGTGQCPHPLPGTGQCPHPLPGTGQCPLPMSTQTGQCPGRSGESPVRDGKSPVLALVSFSLLQGSDLSTLKAPFGWTRHRVVLAPWGRLPTR